MLLLVSQLSFLSVVQAKAVSCKGASIQSTSFKQPTAPLPVSDEDSQEAEEDNEDDHLQEFRAEFLSSLLFVLSYQSPDSLSRFNALNLQKLNLCFFSFHGIQRI